jgi:hypothetical protein
MMLLGGSAAAETHRVALLVANNRGAGERPPLRYAEDDAAKLGQTLTELGGVRREDLTVLAGRSLSAVRAALDEVTAKVARLRGERVVLIFYFSGHSDGEALEIGGGRLEFSELRRWLASTGADVRLLIVDSCRSGALLAEKGGTPGPAFQIRLSDELTSTGEALLTSAAADEAALESREIRGSFFTHHLVSGLRGAADASGDGAVTLAEAYDYAFSHTVSATTSTLHGPQHPAYDYRLSGQGDLVLTRLDRPTALLELPRGFDRILVVDLGRDQVVAELPAGSARRLAVPPGEYGVRAWRSRRAFAARFEVKSGMRRSLRGEELALADATSAREKGGELIYAFPRPARFHPSLYVAAGAGGGVALDALASVRLGVRSMGVSGVAVNLTVSSAHTNGFAETTAVAWLGYRFGFERRWLSGFIGFEAGGGLISQDLDRGGARRSGIAGAALWPGLSARLGARFRLSLEAEVPLVWVRQDGRDRAITLPAGWLGALVTL